MNKLKIFIVTIIIIFFYFCAYNYLRPYTKDMKETFEIMFTAISGLAVLIGGFWAYHNYVWRRKDKLRGSLKDFRGEISRLFSYQSVTTTMSNCLDSDEVAQEEYINATARYQGELTLLLESQIDIDEKLKKKIQETFNLYKKSPDDTRLILLDNYKRANKQRKKILKEIDDKISYKD